jgi:hypothetical protein
MGHPLADAHKSMRRLLAFAWRSWLIPLGFGLAVAGAVWWWPAQPMWRSGPNAGKLWQFSADERTIVVAWEPPSTTQDPEVSRWDVETGRLLGRVRLPCADPAALKSVGASPDGTRALVGEGFPDTPASASFASGDWYLHDAVTGRRLMGPIPGAAAAGMWSFSPDSRWFYIACGDRRGGFRGVHGCAIGSAASGRLVVRLDERQGLKGPQLKFAPDGNSACAFWAAPEFQAGKVKAAIQVIDLPSGRDRRWLDLPARPWTRVESWDGRQLVMVVSDGADAAAYPRHRCIFDLAQGSAGEGIDLSEPAEQKDLFWKDGPGWRARFEYVPPGKSLLSPRLAYGLDLALGFFGIRRDPQTGNRRQVRFVDPDTGATRYELPRPVRISCIVSPSGRRMACNTADNGVEVWDVDPPPRWPWAVGAGLVAAAVTSALGRLRVRWHARRAAPTGVQG